MLDERANFAQGELSAGIDTDDTSVVLGSGEGALFPTPTVGYNCVIWNKGTYANPADDPDREIVRVTGLTSDTFTVTRAQESTSAASHASGCGFMLTITAKMIDDIVTDLSGKAPVLGDDDNYVTNAEKTAIGTIGDKQDSLSSDGVFIVTDLASFKAAVEDTSIFVKTVISPATISISENLSLNAYGATSFYGLINMVFAGDYNVTITSEADSSPTLAFYGGLYLCGQSSLRNVTISATNACDAGIMVSTLTSNRAALTISTAPGYLNALYYEKLSTLVGGSATGPTQSYLFNTYDAATAGAVMKADYNANTILYATTDNTPAALTVGEQTIVGRKTGGAIEALAIDSDLSSVSANNDTIPSAKATKAALDGKASTSLTGVNQTKAFTLIDPKGAYGKDHEIFVWKTDAAITITKLEVSCDANPTTELTGDLKWADAFIGFANATVINDFDTTDGVRSDTSITAGAVGAGKCIYISFDAEPDADLKQINFSIVYDND